ncbi:unnamed protein product [Closterium sp. Naga37s-1]|nr:unnamed protein product [Closterium sp. Naga37s-1]
MRYPRLRYPPVRYPCMRYPRLRYPPVRYPCMRYPRLRYPPVRYPCMRYPRLRYPPVRYPCMRYPRLRYPPVRYPCMQYPPLRFPPCVIPACGYPRGRPRYPISSSALPPPLCAVQARAGRREAGIALGGARGKGEGRNPLLAGVSGEEQETARRVLELADRSLASYSVLHSSFLSPASQAAIMPVLSNMADVTAILSGGYFQAERCRVSVGPTELMAAEGVGADAAADDAVPALAAGYPGAVAAVRVSGAFKQTTVSHGDFLGAVLGTGITRDKVGDVILLEGEGAQVIISPDLQDFLFSSLTAVHRVPVTVQPITLADLSVSPPRIDTLRTVEASLRLDAVASAAFRLSRSKFTDLIAKGDVRVNWREAAKSGVVLKSGDVVSVRGKGRCKTGQVGFKSGDVVSVRGKGRCKVRRGESD